MDAEDRSVNDLLDEIEDELESGVGEFEKATQNVIKMKSRLLCDIKKSSAVSQERNISAEQIDSFLKCTQHIVDICVNSSSVMTKTSTESAREAFEDYKSAVEVRRNELENQFGKLNALREALGDIKEADNSN